MVEIGIQLLHRFKRFLEQVFGLCPFGGEPFGRIERHLREGRCTHFALHRRANDEGAETHRQFAQSHQSPLRGHAKICRCRQSHAAANGFSVDASYNDFRAAAHGIDDVSKAGKKGFACFKVLYTKQFVETRPGTKSFVFGAAQHDDFYIGIPAGRIKSGNQFCQLGEGVDRAYIPASDTRSCPVRECVQLDYDDPFLIVPGR